MSDGGADALLVEVWRRVELFDPVDILFCRSPFVIIYSPDNNFHDAYVVTLASHEELLLRKAMDGPDQAFIFLISTEPGGGMRHRFHAMRSIGDRFSRSAKLSLSVFLPTRSYSGTKRSAIVSEGRAPSRLP